MAAKKKVLFLLAGSALLVSCGGGGGDSPVSAPLAQSTPTSGTLPAASDPPPAANSAVNPTQASNTTPSATPPASAIPVAVDQQLKGYLEMVANQFLYIRTNRVIYLPVDFGEFESDRGIVDVASGSPTAHVDIDTAAAGCNPAIDGTCGIQPPAAAPVAPIAAFGIRISTFVHPSTPTQAVGNQTVVGRIAVDLTERPDSPGIGAKETAEIMRFIIDKVEMTVAGTGELTSVKVQDGGQIHVYGRNAAGLEVQDDIPAPAGTVRLLPMSAVPDNHGDTTSVNLLLDLETGFSKASAKLAALQNIAGHFAMHVTFSSVQDIVRPASAGLEQKDLIGQTITVNGQAPVNGAGINGNAWIRMYPSL